MRNTVAEHHRPDRDARVEDPLVGQGVADGAGIRPAAPALELRDQLHCPDLRRAGNRPRREARAEEVERGDAVRQFTAHLRDEVRHVGVPLDLEEALDLDRTGDTDP